MNTSHNRGVTFPSKGDHLHAIVMPYQPSQGLPDGFGFLRDQIALHTDGYLLQAGHERRLRRNLPL